MNFSGSSTLANEVTTFLRGNTGNVNIFSASLLTKIPFIIIGILHYAKSWKKWFLSLSLSLTLICILFVNARASLLTLIFLFIILLAYLVKSQSFTKQFFISKAPFLLNH